MKIWFFVNFSIPGGGDDKQWSYAATFSLYWPLPQCLSNSHRNSNFNFKESKETVTRFFFQIDITTGKVAVVAVFEGLKTIRNYLTPPSQFFIMIKFELVPWLSPQRQHFTTKREIITVCFCSSQRPMFLSHYVKCRYVKSPNPECCYTKCHYT